MIHQGERRAWTREELDTLTQFYGSEGSSGVMARTGRTREAVQRMANRMGLRGIDPQSAKYQSLEEKNAAMGWREHEDEVLKEYYRTEGAYGCLPYLPGRTYKAAQRRASHLGIIRDAPAGKMHKAFMSWLFGQPGELKQSIGVVCV